MGLSNDNNRYLVMIIIDKIEQYLVMIIITTNGKINRGRRVYTNTTPTNGQIDPTNGNNSTANRNNNTTPPKVV